MRIADTYTRATLTTGIGNERLAANADRWDAGEAGAGAAASEQEA
jgi:hypothetical protein